MDDKEVRVDSGLGASIQNDCNKRLPNGNGTYTSRDKSYPDSSHPLGKTDTRPCAIIGPDRVLPPTNTNDVYMKTIPAEPWEYPDNYRHSYDTIKMSEYHQTHNISPRQTFQENMQRVMVPPTYSSIKSNDETSLKNPKLNVPAEGKYCDVPYSINTLSSEPKSVQSDSAMPVINPSFQRGVPPHGWAGGGMQPLKPYQGHDYYHNTEYSNCPAPRPMPIVQPQRIVHDDLFTPMYSDRLYQESNIRFKPYPTSKEKFPQPRYEYANTFHPPQNPIPKFDIQKSMHGHPYPMYAQGPYKYNVDRRYPESMVESHTRALYPQHNAFRTHPVHPSYGPLPGNYYNNKPYPYPTDNPRPMHANNKIYLELENSKYKAYPSPDNFYYSDRAKLMRGDILLPGHTPMNSMGSQHLFKKDNLSLKSIDHSPNYPYREHRSRGNPLARMPLPFSPNTVPMSPCDSNTSHEALMLGIPQEDCGYVSQSSTTSVRSMDSNNSPADFYKRQGFHYNTSTNQNAYRRVNNNSKPTSSTDNKKGLNLSQFFQMWNEGDEEVATSNTNEVKINPNYVSPKPKVSQTQEQLYILGSVTVPQEELSKYEHLQKVSKLPENIKGYNNIEILNQFEQLVESPGMNNLHVKNPLSKQYKAIPQTFPTNQIKDGSQRPVSPLDVEAKISQSVIHKEVGCNFEIKPCSPKVLNVDVAAPVHDVLGERFIEKVANPVLLSLGNDPESKIEIVDNSTKATSCKMANNKYDQNIVNSVVVKPLYPPQDLNTNMGLCLASLPQLDSDIDLNLPEVNQQFIDANKIETAHRSSYSLLENANIDSSLTKHNSVNKIPEELSIETDKEITKLSKYRKTKRADPYINNQIISSSVSSAQRTDSVIIKNPENVKVCNEIQKESLEVEKSVENKTFQESNINETEIYKEVINSINFEKAIDFSVNRNEETINTMSEASESVVSLSKESHFYQSNTKMTVKSSKKKRKSEKSYDSKSPEDSSERANENFIHCGHDSDFCSTNKEIIHDKLHESETRENLHEKRIPSEELPKNLFCDSQSETSTSLGRELNEKQKINIEGNKKEIKIFTDNPTIKRCDNDLPVLSFELVDGCDLQSTDIHYNTNKNTNDSKLELTVDIGCTTEAKVKNLEVKDSQITNLSEICNCAKQTNSEKNTETAVDTIKIADTIEKELEDMDAKIDETSKDLSDMYLEADTNLLGQEELNDIQTTNVSVIKLSDLSHNIENKECSIESATSDIQKCASRTDVAVDNEFLESQNEETLLSSTLINEKVEQNSECLSDKKNTHCEQLLSNESLHNSKNKHDKRYSIEEEICCSLGKNVDNDLERDTCSKMYRGDYKNTPFNIKANTEVDTNRVDSRFPVTVNSCDKIKEIFAFNDDNSCKQAHKAVEFGISKASLDCTLQNYDVTFTPEDDDRQNNTYKKFNSAHHKRWVHRKSLFSPFVQNLILYNIDDKNFFKNENDTKTNILNRQVQLDKNIVEDINIVYGSNNDAEDHYIKQNIEDNQIFCTSSSEPVEDSQNVKETNVYANHECSEINQNCEKVDEKLSETDDTNFLVSSDFKHTHPVRSSSPLNFAYNNNEKLQKRTFKRSLSDSALQPGLQEDESLSTKRYKKNNKGLNVQSPSIETNLSNILRRNSISEIYNDGNVVILIDKDLILTEESQETKICFAEEEETTNNYDSDREIIDAIAENLPEYDKELWVDDVACTETVFSDDIVEDVVIGSSPKKNISSNYEAVNNESFMLCEEVIKNMENDVDVNELNSCHDSTYSIHIPYDYRDSHVDDIFTCLESPKDSEKFSDDNLESNRRKAENILSHFETSAALFPKIDPTNDIQDDKENFEVLNSLAQETQSDVVRSHKLNAQQNSDCENYDSYSCKLSTGNYSSSPEVTSTTCEDKTPGIILKISNHKRSKSSQLDDSKPIIKSNISYKLTEKKKYKPNLNSSGTLVTKAAQKYIPPIKITISDLKVKLPLPKNSLDKLKQMKKSKVAPKIDKKTIKTYSLSTPREIKKPKPKFEDVLMSIDKFQYNKPKVKNKKTRDQIPKMVIKKNDSGSHYMSSSTSSSEDTQSPDLTGRKWQPWVFIEKNTFVDKMALKHKVKAIYCRRKKSYILSEKFRKYKSVYNAKFVISQPKSDDLSKGNLKYTIRLKHH